MKINNKGMTLTELLVSIVMLSVAMVLMYGLMSNLQKKRNDVDLRADDLIRIADIESKLQQYIMKPSDYGRASVNSVTITVASNTSASIIIDSVIHSISITNSEGSSDITYSNGSDTEKWTLKNKECKIENIEPCSNNSCNPGVKRSYLQITCTAKSNDEIKDYIKIPMYFSKLSPSIIQ